MWTKRGGDSVLLANKHDLLRGAPQKIRTGSLIWTFNVCPARETKKVKPRRLEKKKAKVESERVSFPKGSLLAMEPAAWTNRGFHSG